MRKVGELMKDLGFREDASDELKIAFIKNLARAAYGVDLERTSDNELKKDLGIIVKEEQLSFNFDTEPTAERKSG